MLNAKSERELAYVVRVDEIKPIAGRDRVECAVVGGWTCMVPKGAFQAGNLGVYFEIDSKLDTSKPEFAFTEKYHGKIKTQKFKTPDGQFWSQGLLMSFADFGWTADKYQLGDFLTSELGVSYCEAEDNIRKAKSSDKYKIMAQCYPEIFRNPFIKRIYKFKFGKKLLFIFFGKGAKKKEWPSWVVKTDEERVQNIPNILKVDTKWIATEKIDGTSTTFTIKRKGRKYDFFVCSRNVVFDKPNKKCFYDTNVYIEMAEKYNIEEVLLKMLKEMSDVEWITLQGETYGEGIQKRDYSIKDHQFVGFNLIDSKNGRWNSIKAAEYCKKFDIPWVPIVDENFTMPNTVSELLEIATDKSAIDGGMREGLVFRSEDGIRSFKAVSNEFLAKYHG